MNRRGLMILIAGGALAGIGAGFSTTIGGTETTATFTGEFAGDKGLDEAIKGVYAVISGEAGEKRDWDKFNAMFTEDAVMGQCMKRPDGTTGYRGFTPPDYVEQNGSWLEENGFFEIETGRQVQRFGQMVHVWSTYEARRTAEGEVFMRGINSIQLVDYGDEGYKIRSIFWNPETENNPLPEKKHKEHGEGHDKNHGEHGG